MISLKNKIKLDKMNELVKNADQTETTDEMMRSTMFSSIAFVYSKKNDSAKIKRSMKKIAKAIVQLELSKVKYNLKNDDAKK